MKLGRVPGLCGHNDGVRDLFVREDASDPVLEAQLAHLDAIERRQEQLFAVDEAELTGSAHAGVVEVPLPEKAWPDAIPAAPGPEADLGAHLAWMELARDVLSARAARNRDELQRLSSQWMLAQRHLDRLRPDEASALVETQARVRERVAADETVSRLLRTLGTQLAAWEGAHPAPDTPLPEADLTLVRRLLEESAEQRARAARDLCGTVLEVLCGVALDLEVVQRQVERDPSSSGEAFRGLGERVAAAVEDMRTLPHAEVITPGEYEPLHSTLRRCVERHRTRIDVDLAWSGPEPAGEELRAAVTWLAQEFLVAAVEGGAPSAGVALTAGPDGVLLAMAAAASIGEPRNGVEAGWVLRCRARAAAAGGSLAVEPIAGRCAVEVRFPA
jgi:signal transduction histidine kinase